MQPATVRRPLREKVKMSVKMDVNEPGDQKVRVARQLFFQEGQDPASHVSPLIARSWRRCLGQVYDVEAPEIATQAQALAHRREARMRLRRHALPELDALAEHLGDSRCVAVLADAEGVILDISGATDFLARADRVSLRPGVLWSEHGRGTNAIGTALAEDHAVEVWGGEHYLERNAILGCSAAPLHDLSGQMLGVLDVSGEARRMHPHTLGMVRMAAGVIEHRMALDLPDAQLLRFHARPDLLGTHREGLIAVRDGRVIGANRAALHLLEVRHERLLGLDIDEVLRGLPSSHGHAVQLRDEQGRSFSAAWTQSRTAHPLRRGADESPTVGSPALRGPRGQGLVEDAVVTAATLRAARVINAGMNVLVQGETGCGKEIFARQLHAASARARGPFIAVNCAALPENLIEAELFGYEEGAFTGAARKGRKGRIREADGGVLFLDEIGDMPLSLQARLLRVLQEHEVQPLGAASAVPVDFSLVCATHQPLQQMVEQGAFRADLYWRLQDHVVSLAPLRERPERLELINRLIQSELGDRGLVLTPDARTALHVHAWPGNWRQLHATLRTLAALAEPGAPIALADLPAELRLLQARAAPAAAAPMPEARPGSGGGGALADLTRSAVDLALQAHGGNVSAAARSLGVHRSTLHRWLSRPAPTQGTHAG